MYVYLHIYIYLLHISIFTLCRPFHIVSLEFTICLLLQSDHRSHVETLINYLHIDYTLYLAMKMTHINVL